MKTKKIFALMFTLIMIASLLAVFPAGAAPANAALQAFKSPPPKFTTAKAFDVSPALSDLAAHQTPAGGLSASSNDGVFDIRPDRGPIAVDKGFSGDGALEAASAAQAAT